MLSDNVKLHLNWIGQAAKNDQLGALEVTNKETGEKATALVVMIDNPEKNSYEMFPVAIIAEDMSEFMDKYQPPEGAEEVSNVPPGGDDRTSAVDGDKGARGAGPEVHEGTVHSSPDSGGDDGEPSSGVYAGNDLRSPSA